MRKYLLLLISALCFSVGFGLTTNPAHAMTPEDESTAFGLAITKFKPGINKSCSEGSISVFYAMAKVAPGYDGQMIDNEYDRGVLVRKGGRKIVTDLDLIGSTGFKGEFIWFAGRGAKLNVKSTSDYVQFNATGPNMAFTLTKVRRDCVEDLGGEEG